MRQVIREGCRLSYRVDGEAGSPAVLLLNSLGTTHELWEPQAPAFSSHFNLIRCDTRGHGQSDAPPGPATIEMLGRDALAILDAAGVSRAHVCGLSLGGLTAMWLGVHAASRVASLVLAGTAARIGSAAMWQERIEQVEASGLAPLAEGSMGRWFTPAFRAAHPAIVARHCRMLEAGSPGGYASCCAALRDTDLRGDIGAIAAPTLIAAGLHDPVTPPADAEEMRRRIPGAEVVLFDAAHILNVEKADAFNERVLAFLGVKGRVHG